MTPARTWQRILDGNRDVRFRDFERPLVAFGFELDRQSGSDRIYRQPALKIRMNIQPEKGNAKAYQIRQLLDLVEANGLQLRE